MTAAFKPKHQRLVLVVLALIAILVAGALAAGRRSRRAAGRHGPDRLAQD